MVTDSRRATRDKSRTGRHSFAPKIAGSAPLEKYLRRGCKPSPSERQPDTATVSYSTGRAACRRVKSAPGGVAALPASAARFGFRAAPRHISREGFLFLP